MRQYYFFGDSVTDSYRVYDSEGLGEGYVRCIAEALHYGFEDLKIHNFGSDGFTVQNVIGRWKEVAGEIAAAKEKGEETTVSVMVGVNDALMMTQADVKPEVAAARFEQDLVLLFDELKAIGPDKVVVYEPFTCGIVRFGGSWDQEKLKTMVQRLQTSVREKAGEYGFIFLETQKTFDQMADIYETKELIEDGIHPAPGGHDLLAQLFMKTIRISQL